MADNQISTNPSWKPCALAIIVKPGPSPRSHLILTQTRLVQNPDYDPLYHMTQEIVGETLLPEESILAAVERGVREECGAALPEGKWQLIGVNLMPLGVAHCPVLHPGEQYLAIENLLTVQSLGEPQPWLGFGVVALISDQQWEPCWEGGDGEAAMGRWWSPAELAKAIESDPKGFMGLHLPVIRRVVDNLLASDV